MYYAQTIWNLFFKEKLHPDEIVARMNIPLVTEQFVNTVIENNRFLRKFPSGNAWDRSHYKVTIRQEIRRRRKAGLRNRPKRLDAKWHEEKDLW